MLSRRSRSMLRLGAPAASVALLLGASSDVLIAGVWCDVEGNDFAAWADSDNGVDTLNYPPDRIVEFEHMRLELDIPDMNTPTLTAKETLTFTALAPSVEELTLDAHQLVINKVYAIGKGRKVDFSSDDDALTLAFEPPLRRGESGGVVIEYEVNDPPEGLLWSPESSDHPGRAAQIHTQGESETNSYWFPCHDSPNVKLTTEILCTVPDGFSVSSNGRLVSKDTKGGRTTFHWSQDLPHSNYLVSLCVGQWDIVDISDNDLPMPVYVPKGMGRYVKACYGKTPAMVRAMAQAMDEPYPWAQYGQALVWDFAAGGMENTSVTTMYAAAILEDSSVESDQRRLDSLIAHELGHQWFGDLLTCNSWDHIWLNEGFATYMEGLWWEAADGYDGGYLFDMWENNRSNTFRDKAPAKGLRPGMVSREYETPDDTFRRRSNPYPKGASILHMLRVKMGDEAFFKGMRAYVDANKFKTVETDDFRKAMEDASGLSLERFFEQWAFRPGTPEITISPKWSPKSKTLSVRIEQTQRIDEELPAFAFELPLHIVTAEGARLETAKVDGKLTELTIPLESEPTMVAVDPWLSTLATRTLKVPEAWLIEQLRSGPTIPSRLDAAIALGEHPGKATVEALSAVLSDSSEHFALRSRCAQSLGDLGAGAELLRLINAGVNGDSRVTQAMLEGLAATRDDGALSVLRAVAADHKWNHRVRAAAIEGIGSLGDESDLPLLSQAIKEVSYAGSIQSAAIHALTELKLPGALELIAPLTGPGRGDAERMRPTAMNAVADLKEQDPDFAYRTILANLNDHAERGRSSAARALAALGDERGLPELRRLSRSHRQHSFRELCADMAKELAANANEKNPNANLSREIEDLRHEVDKLRKMIEEQQGEDAGAEAK
ncbi:MAG: HEAT repeat domain-containing protein [Phycisphaeraceae bacterium]|nr:HEAT repeat domain-containing protein [Phycisphaeraceae bacterium]